DPLRSFGNVERLQQWGGRHPVVREVVLRDQDEVEPHLLRVLDLLDPLLEELLPVAQLRVRPLVEQSESHAMAPSRESGGGAPSLHRRARASQRTCCSPRVAGREWPRFVLAPKADPGPPVDGSDRGLSMRREGTGAVYRLTDPPSAAV